MTNATHCSGTTLAGAPCRARLNLSSTGLCLSHDPERREQARAIQAAGGRAAGPVRRQHREEREASAKFTAKVPAAPKTIEDAERFASWLTHAVCIGEIDARTAHEAAVCLREFRGAAEKRALEREIQSLRAEVADVRGKTRHTGTSTRPRLA